MTKDQRRIVEDLIRHIERRGLRESQLSVGDLQVADALRAMQAAVPAPPTVDPHSPHIEELARRLGIR